MVGALKHLESAGGLGGTGPEEGDGLLGRPQDSQPAGHFCQVSLSSALTQSPEKVPANAKFPMTTNLPWVPSFMVAWKTSLPKLSFAT